MDILSDLNALKADYSAAQTLLEEAKGNYSALEAKLADKDKAIAEANALAAKNAQDLTTQLEAFANLKAELEAIKATQKTAEERAVEIVASQGIKPLKVDSKGNDVMSRDEAIEGMRAIKNPVERAKFYFAHKVAIYGN